MSAQALDVKGDGFTDETFIFFRGISGSDTARQVGYVGRIGSTLSVDNHQVVTHELGLLAVPDVAGYCPAYLDFSSLSRSARPVPVTGGHAVRACRHCHAISRQAPQ